MHRRSRRTNQAYVGLIRKTKTEIIRTTKRNRQNFGRNNNTVRRGQRGRG